VRGIVVDGRVGWTGGFGIDDKWLGDGHAVFPISMKPNWAE
jgi:hypothetical protein